MTNNPIKVRTKPIGEKFQNEFRRSTKELNIDKIVVIALSLLQI